jgi:guanyl-specific ribonuclease Sa
MIKNYSQLLVGIVVGLIAGLLIGKTVFVNNKSLTGVQDQNRQTETRPPKDNEPPANPSKNGNSAVPPKVFTVLKYIKANNQAMDGYVGGRVFTNREKVLPDRDASGRSIAYQEWDVNPKTEGQNRGTERICTGSDGRSWYTNDHYGTFTEIK